MAAVLAIAVNTATGAALIRWAQGRWFWWLNGLGFFFRAGVVFGGAHWLWTRGASPGQLVFFIVVVAVAQMIGQIYFLEKTRKQRG